jgi:hypothetical protein
MLPIYGCDTGHGLRPSHGFFSAGLASITARIASRCLCTTSRKASTVGDDGAVRRQLIRNSYEILCSARRAKARQNRRRAGLRQTPRAAVGKSFRAKLNPHQGNAGGIPVLRPVEPPRRWRGKTRYAVVLLLPTRRVGRKTMKSMNTYIALDPNYIRLTLIVPASRCWA